MAGKIDFIYRYFSQASISQVEAPEEKKVNGRHARKLRKMSNFKPNAERNYHQFNNSHNYVLSDSGGLERGPGTVIEVTEGEELTARAIYKDYEGKIYMEPFNEATMFDVIQEVMNTEQLDHLSIEDQMLVLDIVADSIKRYKAIELDVFLNDVHDEYKRKKLSDL